MTTSRYVDQLDATRILQAQADSQALWGGSMSLPDRMARQERNLQRAGPKRFRMAGLVDDCGAVVSSAELYALAYLLDGALYPAAGIAGLFTPERCRRAGHATRLLQLLAERSAESGCKALLLFSDIAPAFYEKQGYVALPAANWISAVKSLPSGVPFSTRVASPADVDRLCRLYESSWPREISRPHRDHFRWTFFRELNFAQPDLLLLDGETVAGYLTARKKKTCYWVDEYVVAAPDEPRLWATIRHLAEESGESEVRGWQSPKPVPAHCRTERRDTAVPMLKYLDPTLANRKFDLQLTHFGSMDHF